MQSQQSGMDIDSNDDADLLRSADDHIRRALDDAAAGESIKSLAMIGASSFVIAAGVTFVVAAVAIKVLR